MDVKDLNEALEGLKNDLKGATEKEIKSAVASFEKKNNEAIELLKKEQKEAFDASLEAVKNELAEQVKAVQDHANKLDVKVNKAKAVEIKTPVDAVKEGIKENFESIKRVKKGSSFDMDIKAVGNMTLSNNLTGDAERDFSNVVAKVPNQKVSFSDLIGVIPIEGGTYTFPREGAGEGSIATQTEGSDKSQRDYDFTHVDVATDFIAGFAVYSKKMANNVKYLEGFLPEALRRDYIKAESTIFNTALAAAATASSEVAASHSNYSEQIMAEVATLEALDHDVNAIVVTTAIYFDLLQTEKSTGAGYGLPIGWTFDGNVLRCLGIPVVKANWLAANKYYVGDWSTIKKVVTEGLSVQFSTEDEDNFRKNNITSRIEAQVGLAIHRPDAIIYGDVTAV